MAARILAAAALVAACGATQPPELDEIEVVIDRAANACPLRIEQRSYLLPGEESRVLAHFQRLKAEDRRVMVRADATIPWRCVGHAIFLGQRAGLRIGFIAEPSPGPAPRSGN